MLNSKKMYLAPVIGVFMLSGCGDDDKNAVDNFVNQMSLNGRYTSECAESDIANLSASTTYQFNTDGTFSRYQDLYSNAECSDANPVGTIEVSGDYSVEDDDSNRGGEMTLNLDKATVIARTSAVVDALNTVSFCGRDDYALDAEVDVSAGSDNTLCPVRDVPDTLYGRYREDDGRLYLNEGGLQEMGQSAQDRPSALDTETVYLKQ